MNYEATRTEAREKEKVRKEQRRENNEQSNCTKWHVDLFHFHRGPKKTNWRNEGRAEKEQMRRRPGGEKRKGERWREVLEGHEGKGAQYSHSRCLTFGKWVEERDGSECADIHVSVCT